MATNDVLDRLEALLAAATPGPWSFERHSTIYQTRPDGRPSKLVIETQGDGETEPMWKGSDADLGLLLAARNAAPALIRLAWLALRINPDHLCHVGTQLRDEAIKALGEVRP